MATNSLNLNHVFLRGGNVTKDTPPTTTISSNLSLKPTKSPSLKPLSAAISSSSSSSSTTSTNSTLQKNNPSSTSLDLLQEHLSTQNYRQADEETRRLIIALAGEQSVKRGYVFFSEVQFIPESELKKIDELWMKFSDNKFGYSIQKKIWNRENRDFTNFFIRVGWMKKLDTEVLQYNYKAFPNEFMWEISKETPDGHLPLTNALRGTQLLNCILQHPAFENDDDEEGEKQGSVQEKRPFSKTLNNRDFKSDYSF